MYLKLEKVIKYATNLLISISTVLLFLMMLQGAIDIIGRYAFDSPLIGTTERSEVLLALMVFFAWGYTQRTKSHVNMDFFILRFSPRTRATINFVTTFMVLGFFIVLGWQSVLTAMEYQESGRLMFVINWPLAPFQLTVTIGALVLCLVLIMDLTQSFLQIRGGEKVVYPDRI